MSEMRTRSETKWGRVWRYDGKRGTVWRIRYRDATGRRVLETLGKEPTWNRKLAERELRRRLVDVERDGFRKPERIRFDDFARAWFRDYLPARNLKATTIKNYRSSLQRHLIPYFGHYHLDTLDNEPELIDRFIAAKLRQGLSPKTVNNLLLDLQVILKTAIRWRLMRTNPVSGANRPKVDQPEMNVLNENEIGTLGAAYTELERQATGDEQAWWRLAHTLTFVALGTALRRGELLALRWRDIQMLEGLLHVREALVAGKLTTPKSRSSRRTIELGPRTLMLLQEHWRRSAYQGDDELVFGHPTLGTPLDPSKLARVYLRPALRRASVTKPFRPFHDLRHTGLTHEAAAGNPHAYIQLKAGHSQGAITERYIHAVQVLFPGAAGRAEERMFGGTLRGR